MDLLRRSLAPITDAAWDEIDEEAARVLRAALVARRVVDVDGPHGMGLGAVNIGRLDVSPEPPVEGVRIGMRRVLPLVEARAELALDTWELDNVVRGAEDVELTPLQEAAGRLAQLEETAVYDGLSTAGIVGLRQASEHEPLDLEDGEPGAWMATLAEARLRLEQSHVEGPYHLVLGPKAHRALVSMPTNGYPITRRVKELLGGDVHLARFATGGLLLSGRGGDARLTLGQDVSIGYHDRQGTSVRLFLSESFTFQVFAPEAVVPLDLRS